MIAMILFIHFNPETAREEAQGFALTTGLLALMIFIAGWGLSCFYLKTQILSPNK